MRTTLTTRTGHETLRIARDIALFFAAPFVGLVYVVAMPFVGLFMLGWITGRKLFAHREALKTVGLCVATPFVGLAYILLLPVAGLATLATIEMRRLVATPATA